MSKLVFHQSVLAVLISLCYLLPMGDTSEDKNNVILTLHEDTDEYNSIFLCAFKIKH